MTSILAKELMQEGTPSSSKKPAKKKSDVKEEPELEGAQSLEELLDATSSRSN